MFRKASIVRSVYIVVVIMVNHHQQSNNLYEMQKKNAKWT